MTTEMSMPFITGPVITPNAILRLSPPQGELVVVSPLSKVQEVLWLDYVRRPSANHYALTLKVDLSHLQVSLEDILSHIHRLGIEHPMLRTTFHLDNNAENMSQSYMAVHDESVSFQKVDIVTNSESLVVTLRQPIDLSTNFPVRWIIQQQCSLTKGRLQTSYIVYAVGHHIAVDGSSMGVLSQKLLAIGRQTLSETSRPTYGEFVQRSNAYLKSARATQAKEFWLSQISNTVPHEWNHPSPTAAATADYRQIDTWTFFANDELKRWSNLYGTSWFRIAIAAIGAVLTGYSQPSPHSDHTLQIAFGARESRFNQCVSHMANTMPIRQPLSELLCKPTSTFADLVKKFGKSISQGKKHEMYPFMSLLEASRSEAGEGESSFMPGKVVVTFSPKLADDRCTIYPVQGVWDLFFCFLEHDHGVSLGVITDPTVFDTATVSALKESFMQTIRLSQQTSDFSLLSLPYLKGRGIGSIIDGPDILDSEAVVKSRVIDWISRRASSQPDALALFCGETEASMTYATLDCDSNGRALYLQQHGTNRGDVVVLHMDRGFNVVVWILAVLKAGACYVILDKALPLARKQAILRVSAPQTFVTDIEEPALFAECSVSPQIVNLWSLTSPMVGAPRHVDTHPDDLAYIIFTSGSTGTPKAIMVEHQNLSSYVSSARTAVSIGSGSRVLQFATFAFDASVLEWAVTLSYGATLCFVDSPSVLVDDYLANMIDLNKINFFFTTPSVLSTIPTNRKLHSLKMLSIGGEAASTGLLDTWRKRVRLIHSYGPTETTVICANEVVDSCSNQLPAASCIGSPNPNMAFIICPENSDRVLENGQTGEICIVGPQVSRGYRGQRELTAEKFHTSNLRGRQVRMYRSGDKGFISQEDGKLHILGRMNDREVKVRGYRMDLAVIEKSILDHCPEAMMATVQVVDESIVCLLVPETIQVAFIRERLSKDLPSYCIPTRFLPVRTLPLNVNGKVDHKKALEEFTALNMEVLKKKQDQSMPCLAEISSNASLARAMTPAEAVDTRDKKCTQLEAIVTNLWQEVLSSVQDISLDTTFYDAGGHSLLLSTLHKKLLVKFPSSKLSLLDVFHNPTIRRQAAHLLELVADNLTVSSRASSISDSWEMPFTPPRSIDSRSSATSISHMDTREDRFAIIGMSGRFPGANTVEDMWTLLMSQKDGIKTSDGSGAKDVNLRDGEMFIPRYGSIEGLDEFSSDEWAMSEDDARVLDPQKRMFLIVAKEALQDASVNIQDPDGTQVGTFVGIASNTFHSTIPDTNSFESRYRVVLDPNASTLTAFKLNLTGPSLDINTACASSMVALHQSINALQGGECQVALVGGVSIVHPYLGGYATSEGKIFSASGECRPLDSRYDGSVPADGVAAVVLKPLSAAQADGDRVYAVIEGHAIGTDGAVDKVGFSVPSSSGQAKVVKEAIANSGVDPSAIRYVEMHGSGTSIGDAIEVQGLERAFVEAESAYKSRPGQNEEPSTPQSRHTSSDTSSMSSLSYHVQSEHVVQVGSNKGNFGNSEAASGMFSLIKAALAVHKGIVPPMRQLGQLNELINPRSFVQPLREHMKLHTDDRIGVTALGYGGVNAHCIVANANASS